jgi:hypothetical protein
VLVEGWTCVSELVEGWMDVRGKSIGCVNEKMNGDREQLCYVRVRCSCLAVLIGGVMREYVCYAIAFVL